MSVRCLTLEPTLSLAGSKNLGGVFKKVHRHLIACPLRSRFNWRMLALTRRRSPDAPDECWHVYFGDVRVGTIAIRTGIPHHEDPWGWACGFYPGGHPAECTSGAAATFDQARVEFEDAWRIFLSNRTEADFETWRAERDWTARKYAMWQAGERLPSQKPSVLMTRRCGQVFDSHRLEDNLIHVPHISAAESVHAR